jgi:hypothetical protein
MTTKKDIVQKQAEIVGQLQQFPIGRSKSGGRAGGTVEVVATNPLPGQPKVVQAKCANDCPPGDVQLIKTDDGSYIALSPNAAIKTSETTTRQVSKKNPTVQKKEDEKFWPVTFCSVHFKVKDTDELLDNNCAAQGDETSWDASRDVWASPGGIGFGGKPAYGFAMRADTLGDYNSLSNALNNILKPDRLIIPSGSPSASAARDNAAWGSGSEDAVMIWFYIGNPANAFTNGKIFKTSGPPMHPNAGNVTSSGQGLCMEVYNSGSISAAIFPRENFGEGPLFQALKLQFPGIGGSVGYAGRIERWQGMADYASQSVPYFRGAPSGLQSPQTPTSTPSWYIPGQSANPWLYTGSSFFQFGWSPAFIGCASSSWVLAVKSAINALDCGGAIASDKWYWGGDAAPTIGRIDWDNPSGYIGTTGMYVCWAGHKDNANAVQGFFEAFRTYWGIAGSVTKLGSANPYGCGVEGPGGTSYPSAPPTDASRFPIECYGRPAEVFLRVEHQDLELMELKLPFKFAAVRTQRKVLGGGSFTNSVTNFESGKTRNEFFTFGMVDTVVQDPWCVECPHATLTIVKRPDNRLYALVNIFYGCVRKWKEPLEHPIKPRLANAGFGTPPSQFYGLDFNYRRYAADVSALLQYVDGYYQPTGSGTPPAHAILIGDYWHCCRFFEVRLPNKEDKTITITKDRKYKLGVNHQDLTSEQPDNPDNEFNSKWLIADFRTDVRHARVIPGDFSSSYTPPNAEYASFGGLPGLIQFVNWSTTNINNFKQVFYKEKTDWTDMDRVYYYLMEAPRQFNPLATVLPSNVIIQQGNTYFTNVIFDFDGRFGRHGRAEQIMPCADFGWNGSYNGGFAPRYKSAGSVTADYSLQIAYSEQVRGNGLLENGILTKWFRVAPSSYPSFVQLKRNNY